MFKLIPPTAPGGAWKEIVLYRETLAGALPNPGLTKFQGAFYYTTTGGTVSRIAPSASGGWQNEVLFAFPPVSPPAGPIYGVLVEPGIIFGTTSEFDEGGRPAGGSVFALTLSSRPGAQWDIEILHEFPQSITDGSGPTGAVVAGKNGVIFGATAGGGKGCGTVWQLTPKAAGGAWPEKILHDFHGPDGCHPASIGRGIGGVLYGTTTGGSSGGSPGNGTVFDIVP